MKESISTIIENEALGYEEKLSLLTRRRLERLEMNSLLGFLFLSAVLSWVIFNL